MVLSLWLSSCALDDRDHEIESTTSEGYGNYFNLCSWPEGLKLNDEVIYVSGCLVNVVV
jgi:hypothetical protein